MPVIGLAGNIGSGKSLAAGILKELGAAVIDADWLARQVVEPGQAAYDEVKAAFGPEYFLPDGKLNRKKLGNLVFADEAARLRLNGITHPRIRQMAGERIQADLAAGYPLVVLEAALLLTSQAYADILDEIWLITASPALIYARLAARDALDLAAVEVRLAAQMPAAEQAALADRVIENNGTAAELKQKLTALYYEVTGQKP